VKSKKDAIVADYVKETRDRWSDIGIVRVLRVYEDSEDWFVVERGVVVKGL